MQSKQRQRMLEVWNSVNYDVSRVISVVSSVNKNTTRRYSKFIGRVPAYDMYRKMELQDWRCMYCKTIISFDTCDVDHVIPLASGGEHYLYNLAYTCRYCNRKKNAKTLKRFCKQMRFDYESIMQEMADINQKLHDELIRDNQELDTA